MPLRLLHVSDIHFRGYGDGWDYDADQRNELLRDARALAVAGSPIEGILVGGDIAFRAASEEYEAAASWLDALRDACGGLDAGRVWTIPGNHDVDRSVIKRSAVLQQFRHDIRACPPEDLDRMLRERLSIDPAAPGLMAPLAAYNEFAGDYQCTVTCAQPHWYDESLACDGLTVRLLGLNSVLISDASDSDVDDAGRLVLGSYQCVVPRREDTVHVAIAHHPPGWIRDWPTVVPYLRRAHVLLFGHEHTYAARQPIEGGTVEVYAGAVGPERVHGAPGGPYAPTYNILTIGRTGDAIRVTVQPRYWDHTRTCFDEHPDGIAQFTVSLSQPPGGESCSGPAAPPAARNDRLASVAPRDANPLASAARPANPLAADDRTAQPPVATELRRIGSEFMRRPWTDRVAIARALNVLTDPDLQMTDPELFPLILRRIRNNGLVPRLIEELDRG